MPREPKISILNMDPVYARLIERAEEGEQAAKSLEIQKKTRGEIKRLMGKMVNAEAVKKLKELGFSMGGNGILVDGLNGAGVDFDQFGQDAKNLVCSVNGDMVTIKIEKKSGPDVILEISENFITSNGEEVPVGGPSGDRYLSDLRWIGELKEMAKLRKDIKLKPLFSGTGNSGEYVEIEQSGFKQSYKVSIDGKPMKIIYADRGRRDGDTRIELACPVEKDGKKMYVKRWIHLDRNNNATIDGDKLVRPPLTEAVIKSVLEAAKKIK